VKDSHRLQYRERESEDRRGRTRRDGKDDWSREYKKGKGVTPGTGNTRNNIQIINDKRKRVVIKRLLAVSLRKN
jgi:hypothetical protein